MKKLLKCFLWMLVPCAALSASADEGNSYLLWMVEDRLVNEVAGGEAVHVSELRSRPDGLSVNYARMMAVKTDGSETESIFLDLYAHGLTADDYLGDFTDVFDGSAGPLWADVTGYDDPAWSFMIELGNLDDSGDEDVWTAMAYSERATYESLLKFITGKESQEQPYDPWTGGSYTVPEPTSGLLVVVGGALLALRRRRRAV